MGRVLVTVLTMLGLVSPGRRARAALLAVVLAFVLVAPLAAVGCGGSSAGEAPTGDGASPPSPTRLPSPATTPISPRAAAKPAPKHSPAARAAAPTAPAPVARIAFVSVGQGDAILIKSGSADILVDGGPEGSAAAVNTAMRKLGMRELDVVVATHMHADHIGAADDLTLAHGPARVLVAGRVHASMRQAARATGADLVQVRRGDTYRWGAVKAKVLSPAGVSGDANADSVVLLLEVGGRRILLTGDLTGPNEEVVAGICARGPPLYALKVSHHGSRFATTSSFLSRTGPRFAVVSVGASSYGHPTPETVSRLTSSGARVYTTQKNGTITLTVRPSGSVRWEFSRSSGPMTKVAQPRTHSGRSTTKVFVTATGERYHSDGCRHLAKSRVPVTLKEAKARGYTACGVCRPPR